MGGWDFGECDLTWLVLCTYIPGDLTHPHPNVIVKSEGL